MVDGECEQLFDPLIEWYLLWQDTQRGDIGGRPIRPDRNMNNWMFQRQRSKAEFGAQKRDDLHLRHQAIGMSKGYVGCRFLAVHGNVAHLNLQTERDYVEVAHLGAAAGDTLNLPDHAASDESLEGISGGVPEAG